MSLQFQRFLIEGWGLIGLRGGKKCKTKILLPALES